MKNQILKFGLISGVLVSIFLIIGTNLAGGNLNYDLAQILGYAGMIIAFSTIFIAIKRQREQQGHITFKEAARIGLGITLIASLLYTITWMIISNGPGTTEMMDNYFKEAIEGIENSGVSQDEMQKQLDRLNRMKNNYSNPFYKFVITLLEIFPVGFIVTLISALILRKKV